jgi:nitrogen fixation protein NifU and related proteins
MKADLYQDAIVAHAKQATRAGRLEAPDASVTLDNPLCGDRVTIDVKLANGRIVDLAHRVRGCLLCEASASVIGANAIGEPAGKLQDAEHDVRAMLEGRHAHNALWPGFEAFAPVTAYKSRHACVLLPLEALRKAVDQADGSG